MSSFVRRKDGGRFAFQDSMPMRRQRRSPPPRSGGEGSGVGGASADSLPEEQADRPPTPDLESELCSPRTPPRARARGGRGAHCAHLRVLAARFARVLPGSFRPLQTEGAGNAGRPMRPIAACAEVVVVGTRVVRSHRQTPGIPRAMVYGLCRTLPGDRAFLSPSPAGISSRRLDAGVEASGPYDFAVRLTRRSSKAHQRPPHPIPHS
jgi:hypothetical protein